MAKRKAPTKKPRAKAKPSPKRVPAKPKRTDGKPSVRKPSQAQAAAAKRKALEAKQKAAAKRKAEAAAAKRKAEAAAAKRKAAATAKRAAQAAKLKAKLKQETARKAAIARFLARLPGIQALELYCGDELCLPSKADRFIILIEGKRSPLQGSFPSHAQRSTTSRLEHLIAVIGKYTKAKLKRDERSKEAKLEKLRERESKEQRRLEREAKAGEAKAQRKLERRQAETQLEDEEQLIALARKGINRLPGAVPKLSQISAMVSRETKGYDIPVIGRDIRKKLREKKQQDRGTGRSGMVRSSGIEDFAGRRMILDKLHVDLAKKIPVFPFNVRGVAVTMKEFFRQYAEQFAAENQGKSQEAYIMRLKTENFMEGKSVEEGVGIPRFRMPMRLPTDPVQIAYLREAYPGLSDVELLRQLQREAIEDQLDKLIDYFSDRYEDYLGRKVITSMVVTGFTMEVVKGIIK